MNINKFPVERLAIGCTLLGVEQVLIALKTIGNPTIDELVTHFAFCISMPPDEIRICIVKTLKDALYMELVVKNNNRFSIKSADAKSSKESIPLFLMPPESWSLAEKLAQADSREGAACIKQRKQRRKKKKARKRITRKKCTLKSNNYATNC